MDTRRKRSLGCGCGAILIVFKSGTSKWVGYGVALWCAAVFACVAGAQVLTPGTGRSMTLSGFRTRGIQDDGGMRWELRGAKAVVKGTVAEVGDAVVVFQTGDQQWRATSPACTFDQATGIGGSEAPLRVESRAMTLDGVGYDIIMDTQVVRVRSKVRMVIARAETMIEAPVRKTPETGEKPEKDVGTAPASEQGIPKQTENGP